MRALLSSKGNLKLTDKKSFPPFAVFPFIAKSFQSLSQILYLPKIHPSKYYTTKNVIQTVQKTGRSFTQFQP